ncbi:PstS family phosphate ABC transporter substrate-binding protein [Alkalicoccus urumqiensis]|uniref:PBP domain-containing protein n=1 Tax=Alkalicoccus urumqiensis TaxID=1548213 RepID=A0A2P6MIG8_ALKUR|nr:substrate-binding domain-containing protein [Alkalicoccus urumqiensis]PRO66070.1 hypothetical protein C6I21_07150 [Alkalicoccus urumqiensis]
MRNQLLLFTGVLFVILFFSYFIIPFSMLLFPQTAESGTVLFAVFAVTAAAAFSIFTAESGRQLAVVWISASAAVFLYAASVSLLDVSLDVDAESRGVELTEYEPFSETGRPAQLGTEASLQLEENAPALDGATALYPVYAAFVEAVYPKGDYMPYSPARSTVVSTQTPDAFERLIAGNTDIIFTAAPSAAQEEAAAEAGVTMERTPIGLEAFVFLVHKSNPVTALSEEEIRSIYSGEISRWSELGGLPAAITAFQRPEGSGSQTALQSFMGETPIAEAPQDRTPAGMGGILEETASLRSERSAIGFSFRHFALSMTEDHALKPVHVNGVPPSHDTIRSGAYPITSEFYAIRLAENDAPEIDELLDWILSEEGQSLVEQSGYVPINEQS